MIFLPMLEEFRNNRGLLEFNEIAFNRMVKQELQEVLDADNWNHRVEEMCDVCVLCFNALAQQGFNRKGQEEIISGFKLLEFAVEMAEIDVKFNRLDNAISNMRDCITLNGYDFELTMVETCKKILSREGDMNHKTGKWERNTNQDKSTLYIPDYDKCKI